MRFVGRFLIVLVCILIFAALSWASEFSADMVNNQFGQDMKGKVFVKNHKMRMENISGQGEESIVIMDLESGTSYLLMPQQKTYMEMSAAQAQSQMQQYNVEEEIAKVADKKFLGTEKVNGYVCDKYEFVYHDTSMGTLVQWYSKKLNYPIKIIYNSAHGVMTTEYRNIREGGVSDSLFHIPSGYQKMSMPAMGSGVVPGMGMEGLGEGQDIDISDILGSKGW